MATKKRTADDESLAYSACLNGEATPEQSRMIAVLYSLYKKDAATLHLKLADARPPYKIKVAQDAMCAAAQFCLTEQTKRRAEWLADKDLYMADGRVHCLAMSRDRLFFMDVITGSLFALGECMTSMEGRTGFVRDWDAATRQMMAWVPGQIDMEGDDGDE